MPKQLPADLLNRVTAVLTKQPEGAAIDDLAKSLAPAVSRRTLQRKLSQWVAAGEIRAKGSHRGRRYFASRRTPIADPPAPPLALEPRGVGSIPVSVEGAEIQRLVRRPIVDREPVGYRREFLDAYEPRATFYLPEKLRRHLLEIGRTLAGPRAAGTYARRILERLLVDLSWNSSRLEGNTYSLLETRQLIQIGQVPAGKDPKETQMILNHKAAIELLVDSSQEIGMNRYTVQNLHALLADNLLDDPADAGRLREVPVGIGGSTYNPIAIPQVIDELLSEVLNKATDIDDPFEQSFFVMVHIPYLQPFVDVNKRTSRLAANIPLITSNLVPLSFIDAPEQDYIDGLVGVYELNRVELLRDIFAWAYERSCKRYKSVQDSMPEPDSFRLKYRNQLVDVVGQAVRGNVMPDIDKVNQLSAKVVPQEDLQRFVTLAITELANLHEGNIARFRLRPAEFVQWQALQPTRKLPRQAHSS